MKTYSELNALSKAEVRRIVGNHAGVGVIVITWNRGQDRTPVAMHTHVERGEHRVVTHLLRSMADQVDTSDISRDQGMTVTPSGLIVPGRS